MQKKPLIRFLKSKKGKSEKDKKGKSKKGKDKKRNFRHVLQPMMWYIYIVERKRLG